jgi:ATP-binding cassette subfamily B (MDR/TAP) protein 1
MGADAGKAMVAAQNVFRIMETESSINAIDMDKSKTGKRISLHDVKGKVEFRNVWFRYPTRKEEFVLRGLNLEIFPGESVALVGESGCGKSTFINMLMRFYDPEFGEVLLDDVNIRDYNLHDLRKVISLVMQEPIVFNYSILENVLYGKPDATNSEVQDACEKANCMEFITKNDF